MFILPTLAVDGILSSRPKDNPYLWNANHIYIPYCSSDAYSGLKPASQSSGRYDQSYSFMGSKIIERIMISLFDDLPQELSLYEAKSVLLAGESAGALGVMLNLDKVNDMINRKFSSYRTNCASSNSKCDPLRKAPVVRGLADSGWFVDNEPLALPLDHNNQNDGDKVSTYSDTDSISFSPEQMIMQSVSHWNGQVPIECSSRYRNKPWLCYFGYRLYQTLRTPLFVVQWLYDGYQLMADNVYPPYNEVQWSYIRKYGNQMRKSLENVTALFAPSCLSHTLITKPGWNKITVNGFKLPHVLNNWEEQSLVQSPELEAQSSTVRLTTDNPARDDTDSMIQAHFLNSQSGRENLQPMIQDRHLTFRSANSRSSSPNGRTRTNRKRRRNNQNQPKSRQHTSIAAISSTDSNLSPAQGALNQPHPIGGAIREILPLVESDGPTDLIVGRINLDAINGRQGRSTPMMDDATVVLGNTVPDDSQQASNVDLTTFSSSQPASWLTKEWVVIKEQDTSIRPRTVATKKTYSSSSMDRFRHVDSCTWPQCNRDCADLESHPYSGVLASF